MVGSTHLVLGCYAVAVAKACSGEGPDVLQFGCVLAGCLFPDVDSMHGDVRKIFSYVIPIKCIANGMNQALKVLLWPCVFLAHRGIMHSLALFALVFCLARVIQCELASWFVVGCIMHVTADLFTPQGVRIFSCGAKSIDGLVSRMFRVQLPAGVVNFTEKNFQAGNLRVGTAAEARLVSLVLCLLSLIALDAVKVPSVPIIALVTFVLGAIGLDLLLVLASPLLLLCNSRGFVRGLKAPVYTACLLTVGILYPASGVVWLGLGHCTALALRCISSVSFPLLAPSLPQSFSLTEFISAEFHRGWGAYVVVSLLACLALAC